MFLRFFLRGIFWANEQWGSGAGVLGGAARSNSGLAACRGARCEIGLTVGSEEIFDGVDVDLMESCQENMYDLSRPPG